MIDNFVYLLASSFLKLSTYYLFFCVISIPAFFKLENGDTKDAR